jgi:hypothetical protein
MHLPVGVAGPCLSVLRLSVLLFVQVGCGIEAINRRVAENYDSEIGARRLRQAFREMLTPRKSLIDRPFRAK